MNKQKFIEEQSRCIIKICEFHKEIKNLDKSLQELHPIAIVDNNIFFVFDVNREDRYEFIMDIENPYPMPMPEGVLAAFPLDFYQNKSSAIIGAGKLENPDNYVFVFHEFVHCFVGNRYESNIRKQLTIEKQQREANNVMWELNYPFPYEDDVFIKMTSELQGTSNESGLEPFMNYHKRLKDYLKETDFEYMIWQEWKEGFARYVENLVREKLRMEKNTSILTSPFDRVCFYEIGSKYIEILFRADPTLKNDMESLFYKMLNYCHE